MRVSGASRIDSLKIKSGFQPIGQSISIDEFADDVRRGLTKRGQKELFSKYLYDEVGSALFEAITVLPEYGLTRADARLLRGHASELADRVGRCMVVELGSGSGSKTRWILSELASREPVRYCPIDISESALHQCWRDLSQIDSVQVVPLVQSYLEGLQQAVGSRPKRASVLVLFLGSTLGNFEPARAEEFVAEVRQALIPGDVFYVSTDLQKEIPRMIQAYADPVGVTGAFNLNLLARINRELDGNFNLSRFQHEARYDARENRIEMHLRSTADQIIKIGADLKVRLRRGESIWTESSYKFQPQDIVELARRTGFECEAQWIDEEWPFAQSLLRAV